MITRFTSIKQQVSAFILVSITVDNNDATETK